MKSISLIRLLFAAGILRSVAVAQTNAFPSSGSVGVGTMSPGRLLEVSGAGSVYSKITSINSFDAAIQFSSAGNDSYIGRLPTSGGGAGTMDFYNSGVRMVIAPSGNVGIGTTNPTQKLSVNGTIRAKEVIVEAAPWPDYVFDDGYKLAPLSEVERHIKTDGHLPGLPSSMEIAQHGVSMGEMQAKLLAKIEELTLHQIAENKAIARLESENSALRSRLSQIEASHTH